MSAPDPSMVTPDVVTDVRPASPTAPISLDWKGPSVTVMPSNVAVASSPSAWLGTARPTSSVAGRLLNDWVPISVHGSDDDREYALTVDPLRESRNHTGVVSEGPAV